MLNFEFLDIPNVQNVSLLGSYWNCQSKSISSTLQCRVCLIFRCFLDSYRSCRNRTVILWQDMSICISCVLLYWCNSIIGGDLFCFYKWFTVKLCHFNIMVVFLNTSFEKICIRFIIISSYRFVYSFLSFFKLWNSVKFHSSLLSLEICKTIGNGKVYKYTIHLNSTFLDPYKQFSRNHRKKASHKWITSCNCYIMNCSRNTHYSKWYPVLSFFLLVFSMS